MIDNAFLLRAAQLAYLSLEPQEVEELHADCTRILSFLEDLKEVDTSGVLPMTVPWPDRAPLREDVCEDANKAQDITRNAADKKENFFSIPRFVT